MGGGFSARGESPYKSCVTYVRRKIVDIGPVFQRRRGPTSTTIRVQFLHLLGNKGVITRKSSGRLIFMISCVVKHNTSFPALRYWFCLVVSLSLVPFVWIIGKFGKHLHTRRTSKSGPNSVFIITIQSPNPNLCRFLSTWLLTLHTSLTLRKVSYSNVRVQRMQ